VDIDPYVTVLGAAFAIALVASAVLVRVMRRVRGWRALGELRGRNGPPAVGGIAILAAFAAAPFVAAALSDRADEYFSPKRTEFLGYLGAVALVFVTGVLDDWRALRPREKLAGQTVAAIAVFFAGFRMEDVAFPWGGAVGLGVLALPATVLWVVFFTNAINLIDGKDGVATGVGVFGAAALAAVAAHTHHPAVALLFVAVAGAGLGFLPFNLPSASLITGDGGALLLGFVLSTLAIRGATGIEESVFVGVPVLALGFPVLDAALSAVRRVMDGRHPFSRDTDHIHHRLEAMGLGPLGILAVLYVLSGLFAGAALAVHYLDSLAVEVAVFAGLVALVGLLLSRLGYVVSLWNSRGLASLRGRVARD
jgi:UDP-GlcNAc:undecaprenyl-phosphate GlcNAc-1-phosphate transferase